MESIQEKNRLIAEFMGNRIVQRNCEDAVFMLPDAVFPEYFRVTKFNTYHLDWNMLMPVVEKIETIEIPDYYLPEFISLLRLSQDIV